MTGGPHVLTVSLTEFSKHTAQIMSEVENAGTPVLVTRHGRFVAAITPVAGHVESRVLTEMAREIGRTRAREREDGVTRVIPAEGGCPP